MSDPRIPRISEQAREARRPLPVSTLLSARQETIHRDPGAARAARSVKVSDKLPDYVEDLLQRYFVTDSARNVVRFLIAKAIRDAEERIRDACVGLLTRMNSEHATFTPAEAFAIGRFKHAIFAIRSLPLENA